MHIIYCNKQYNYNPSAYSGIKIEINYKLSGVAQTVYSLMIPNSLKTIPELLSYISAQFLSSRSKNISFNYTDFEYIKLTTSKSNLTFDNFKLYIHSNQTSSYFLALHMGLKSSRSTGTETITITPTANEIIFPYWGAFRFPINSNSRVATVPNLSARASDWSDIEISSNTESDITPVDVYSAYNRTIHFKKVAISNLSWHNVKYADLFKEYSSEVDENKTFTIDSSLASILFESSAFTSVKLNPDETKYDSELYTFENLVKYNICIAPTSFFNRT